MTYTRRRFLEATGALAAAAGLGRPVGSLKQSTAGSPPAGAPGVELNVDGTALPVGVWQHVAVARSGNTVTVYLNGASVGSGPVNGILPDTARNFIGRSQFPDPLLSGSLDDFRIYTRALSASEIGALAGTTTDGG